MNLDDSRLQRTNVIGVPITATNMMDTVSLITEKLDELHGEYICVSNAHTCVVAHDNPIYWAAQAESVMSLPDGKPLSVLGRRTVPSMDRVTGPDFMREVFSKSPVMGWSHYFYGNKQTNLDRLSRSLLRDYPGLQIAGMEPSVFRPLTEREKDELANRITASNADFAWIAIGAPQQELLMHDLKGKTDALMVGVGGAFNVLAGIVPEAPKWMQDLSLEWFYRLAQEPRRLIMRYAVTNTKFILYSLTNAKRKGAPA